MAYTRTLSPKTMKLADSTICKHPGSRVGAPRPKPAAQPAKLVKPSRPAKKGR